MGFADENKGERIKRGLADYIGYSCYFFALASLGGLIYWLWEVYVDAFEFRWSILIGFIAIIASGIAFGILIFRRKE